MRRRPGPRHKPRSNPRIAHRVDPDPLRPVAIRNRSPVVLNRHRKNRSAPRSASAGKEPKPTPARTAQQRSSRIERNIQSRLKRIRRRNSTRRSRRRKQHPARHRRTPRSSRVHTACQNIRQRIQLRLRRTMPASAVDARACPFCKLTRLFAGPNPFVSPCRLESGAPIPVPAFVTDANGASTYAAATRRHLTHTDKRARAQAAARPQHRSLRQRRIHPRTGIPARRQQVDQPAIRRTGIARQHEAPAAIRSCRSDHTGRPAILARIRHHQRDRSPYHRLLSAVNRAAHLDASIGN